MTSVVQSSRAGRFRDSPCEQNEVRGLHLGRQFEACHLPGPEGRADIGNLQDISRWYPNEIADFDASRTDHCCRKL